MERITDEMLKNQSEELNSSLDEMHEIAMRWKADSERIDKIERLAKANVEGRRVMFALANGELHTNPWPSEDALDNGWYATVREAIDAAPEGK